jgi:hypothetical protein
VGDPFAVRRIERVQYLSGVFEGLPERHRPFECSFNQLHHQVIRPHVVDLADVRMIEGGDGARLAFEALSETPGRDLDGDFALQSRVPRTINLPIPPAPIGERFGRGRAWSLRLKP